MDATSQLPLESLLARDASKRKRVNRSAKLKQFKLDARREQWLSQGTGKLAASMSPTSVLPKGGGENEEQQLQGSCDSDAESCVINHDDLCDGGQLDLLLSCNFNSSVSKSISCSSQKGDGCVVVLDGLSHHHKRKSKSKSKSKNKSSSACSASDKKKDGCDKGSRGQEEEEDWEAAADALDSQMNLNKDLSDLKENKMTVVNRNRNRDIRDTTRDRDDKMIQAKSSPPAAWKVDDIFRPASLPRVMTPSSLPPLLPIPMSVSRQARRSSPPPPPAGAWMTNRHRDFFAPPAVTAAAAAATAAGPASCPICTEELDSTDSSFHPCSCGFRLCLFCHHRIAAEDGRCPGCRKAYKTEVPALRPCTAT